MYTNGLATTSAVMVSCLYVPIFDGGCVLPALFHNVWIILTAMSGYETPPNNDMEQRHAAVAVVHAVWTFLGHHPLPYSDIPIGKSGCQSERREGVCHHLLHEPVHAIPCLTWYACLTCSWCCQGVPLQVTTHPKRCLLTPLVSLDTHLFGKKPSNTQQATL
jgi:hypothetical protein